MAWIASEGAVLHSRLFFPGRVVSAGLVADADMIRTPLGMVTSVATWIATPLKAGPMMAGTPTSLARWVATPIGSSKSWHSTMTKLRGFPSGPPGMPTMVAFSSMSASSAPLTMGRPTLSYSAHQRSHVTEHDRSAHGGVADHTRARAVEELDAHAGASADRVVGHARVAVGVLDTRDGSPAPAMRRLLRTRRRCFHLGRRTRRRPRFHRGKRAPRTRLVRRRARKTRLPSRRSRNRSHIDRPRYRR